MHVNGNYFLGNANNTPSNTRFPTYYILLIKIHIGPTKLCGSHIN